MVDHSKNCEIDSHFINIGIGDGAVHVLLKRVNHNEVIVQRTVLIDGGLETAQPTLIAAIDTIRTRYNTPFKFDAVVITHWDGDHYRAICKMLYDDVQESGESSYIDRTKTKIYFPWRAWNKIDTGKIFTLKKEEDTNKLALCVHTTTWGYVPLCEAVSSTNCLGYDLFTGLNIDGDDNQVQTAVENIEAAYGRAQHLRDMLWPVFLCVGVDGEFINRAPVAPKEWWKKKPDLDVSKTMNSSSIMTCIIWPRLANGMPRISLYTGGDAGEHEEGNLVNWMKYKGNLGLPINARLDMIKAGHHGSHFSTPEGLLEFNTDIWIISAGFAVLFFLLAIAHEKRPLNPPKIIATCPPYWLYEPLEYLTVVDFNLKTLLGFAEGADKLALALEDYVEKSDIVLSWFKESAALMRTVYSIEYTKDQMKKLDLKFKNSVLTKVEKLDGTDKKLFYKRAIEEARNVMRVKWNLYGEPDLTAKTIESIVVKATSTTVERVSDDEIDEVFTQANIQIDTSPLLENHIWVFREGSEKNTGSFNLYLRVTGKDDGKMQVELDPRRLQNSEINERFGNEGTKSKGTKSAASNTKLYDWTMRLFVDDLKVQGNLPPTMKRFPLEGDSSARLKWFRHCLGISTSITIDGTVGQGESIDLQEIRIEFPPPSKQKTALVFTTSYKAREQQFGSDVNDQRQNHLGFDERIQGILFALEPSNSAASYTLKDFAALISFKVSPWVLALIGELPLVPHSGPGARSGLWFIPCYNSRTIVRLEMKPDTNIDAVLKLEKVLQDALGPLQITNVVICGICVHEKLPGTNEAEVTSVMSLEAKLTWTSSETTPPFDGKIKITFTKGGFRLTLELGDSSNVLEKTLEWIQERLSASADILEPPEKSSNELKRLLGDFTRGPDSNKDSSVQGGGLNLRSVSMSFSGEGKPISFDCSMEVHFPCEDKKASFLVSFSWSQGTYQLSADLWNEMSYGGIPRLLHPYHMGSKLPPDEKRVGFISIRELLRMPDLEFPEGIPDKISQAHVSFVYSPKFTSVSLEATMESLPPVKPKNKSSVPPIRLERLYLALGLKFPSGGGGPDFTMRFRGGVILNVSSRHLDEDTESEILIRTMIEYVKDGSGYLWDIGAEVKNVKMANLYELFAGDGSNDAIMEIMSKISIPNAYINYTHHSENGASLVIGGILRLGSPECSVDLSLVYSHSSNTGWSFTAELKASPDIKDKDLKIADLLTGLVDDLASLPEMVQKLVIPMSELEINLACKSITDKDKSGKSRRKHVIFCLIFQIGTFTISFTQIRCYDDSTAADLPAPATTPGRLLRFSISDLPELSGIPGIGTMPRPFDQLGVVWSNRNISAEEISILNDEVFHAHLELLVKENKDTSKGGSSSKKPNLPYLVAGCHFQVAALEQSRPKLILDYVAGRETKKKPENSKKGLNSGGTHRSLNDEPTDTTPSDMAVAPMVKNFGPVSISSIGVSVKETSKVTLVLDAEVRIGPLSFALLGFAITVDLSSVKQPEDLKNLTVKVDVSGMSVGYDNPPTKLAGMFLKFDNQEAGGFEGAITIAMGVWSAIAGGMYEELKPTLSTKSFFVFGMLQGPIAEFGCAEINGITGGFGYNSHLEIPSEAKAVPDFPFIALNTRRKDAPKGISSQLALFTGRNTGGTGIIRTKKDSLWFAAGLGIKAFQAVDAQAVFALNLSPQPKFAVIAQATAVFPKNLQLSQKSDDPLANAFLVLDLGLLAVFDPSHCILFAKGELTPRSFILSPSCPLTGGFALSYFLPGSAQEGDFVFTIGGYHPKYNPPAHYPPAPPPVRISWEYDSNLTITGEAYFAISPQVAMGGGRLDMVLTKDWGRASFSAYADFFMSFHPFYFEAEVGITLIASVNIGWKPFDTHLGPKEFTARLDLNGPPIAGKAHLDLTLTNYTVVFGQAKKKPEALELGEFLRIVKSIPPESSDQQANEVPNHLFSVTHGIVTTTGKPDAPGGISPIKVRGSQLQFEVQTRVPILTAKIGGSPERVIKIKRNGREEDPEIYSSPMQRKLHRSHLDIDFVRRDKKGQDTPETSVQFECTPLLKKVPPALWGQYKGSAAEGASAPMIEHAMGHSVKVAAKKPSPDAIPAFSIINFNAVDVGADSDLPKIETVKKTGVYERFTSIESHEFKVEVRNSCEGKRQDVLEAWNSFQAKFSNGGSGLKDQQVPIFSKEAILLNSTAVC